jgi:iron complex outermembrane receptor protein
MMTPQRAALVRHYVLNRRAIGMALPFAFLLLNGLAHADDAAADAPAEAAAAEPGGLQEVVVTAQKRAQSAISAPLSVTALDASSLESHQVDGLQDIQLVSPGVRNGQTNGVNRLFIRGIGLTSFASGADPSSGFYIDNVYVGRPSFQMNSFFDVDRVEVVRGPQGTLFGRNATGGAVSIFSREPTAEYSGYLDYSTGNYNLNHGAGAISGPLNSSGTLLARVAFDIQDHSGYGHDLAQNRDINNDNEQAARATLEWQPVDYFNWKLTGEYYNAKDSNYFNMSFGSYPGYVLAGLYGPSSPTNPYPNGAVPAGIAVSARNGQDAATSIDGDANIRRAYAATSLLHYDISAAWRLESITGWRNNQRLDLSNSDGTSAGLGQSNYHETSSQVSQEFQLGYHDSKLDGVGGLYYYHEYVTNHVLVPFPQFSTNYIQDGQMPINAYAAFAQATYSVLPELRLTAGGRYSSEKRASTGSFTGIGVPVLPIDQEKRWTAFTPKGGIEYDIVPGTMAYLSVTRGFKSGTFNVGQNNPAIDPEKITAYELGLKSLLLDHRLELTTAAFYYNYTDLQVNKIIGIATLTTNAAAAKNKGIEAAVRARLTDKLTVDANATYLDATFTDFDSINPLFPDQPAQDLSGKLLPGAPKVTTGIGAEYTQPLPNGASLAARGDLSYASRVYFTEFNDPVLSQGGAAKLNASLRYESESGRYSVTAWGKNVTNRLVANNMVLGIALWGYPIYGAIDPPATYGVTLGVKF